MTYKVLPDDFDIRKVVEYKGFKILVMDSDPYHYIEVYDKFKNKQFEIELYSFKEDCDRIEEAKRLINLLPK